jgi:hypothetical protein
MMVPCSVAMRMRALRLHGKDSKPCESGELLDSGIVLVISIHLSRVMLRVAVSSL